LRQSSQQGNGDKEAAMVDKNLPSVWENNVAEVEANGQILRPSFSSSQRSASSVVTFHMNELNEILRCYGKGVAEGEWRDYALDFMSDQAIFSIFRRTSDTPLYQIVKDPSLVNRQGAYLISSNGRILRRGHDLSRVLSVLDRRVKLVLK